MNNLIAKLLIICTLAVSGYASAFTVKFDQSSYLISPNDTFTVQVVIDGNDSTSALEPIPNGLFSYGLQITFDENLVQANSVNVVPELDYIGFSSEADITISNGVVTIKGNIDQESFTPYSGTVLATIEFTDLGIKGSYDLQTAIYRTLGPSEQVWIDGIGTVLDNQMTFKSTEITDADAPVRSRSLIPIITFILTNRK